MINSSIKRIKFNLIDSVTSSKAIQIFFINQIEDLKTILPEKDCEHLKLLNFKSNFGEKIILPDPDGKIGKVIIGCNPVKTPYPLFFLGHQLAQLPGGIYSLKKLPKNINFNEVLLGFYFSFYTFEYFKHKANKAPKSLQPQLCDSPLSDHSRLNYLVESEYITRDLINFPANNLGPAELENYAKSFSDFHKVNFKSIIGKKLMKSNLPLIYEVGKASEQEPRLLEIRYGRNDAALKVTLVGKGVCFDSGGLNLKNPVGMKNMKKDMGGAAVVLGLGHYLISLGLDLNLKILLPCVENSISSKSFRQGDVLNSRIGKSIEIQNTDAEGRLILADALTLAAEENPDLLVSFATLTGAARVAMGTDITPFFSTNDRVTNLVKIGGEELFDPVWQMPFYEDYNEQLGSEIADLNNAPSGGMAGSITAALFLKKFTSDHKNFLHFDIFGWNLKSRPGKSVGGLLQGSRALAFAIEKMVEEKKSL